MGGYGSGWYRERRTTVEECKSLAACDFSRWGLVTAPRLTSGALRWSVGEREVGSIGYAVLGEGEVELYYGISQGTAPERSISYRVKLVSTPVARGGRRWWFLCPMEGESGPCGRRVAALYLPPRSDRFACRHCHDLTYTSCRESGKYDSVYRMLAASTGYDMGTVRRVMNRLAKDGRRR